MGDDPVTTRPTMRWGDRIAEKIKEHDAKVAARNKAATVQRINRQEPEMESLTDEQLRAKTAELKDRLAGKSPPTSTPEQIIQAALAPPAATLRVTDSTTDEELSDFIRGRRRGEQIDPDNPPLTGKEVWGSWGDRVNAKIKAYDAKVAARQQQPKDRTPNG